MARDTGDVLLSWLSVQGDGQIDTLRTTVPWLAKNGAPGPVWSWMREMTALGYIDTDWRSGFWEVRRPLISALPGNGVLLYCTGALTQARLHELQQLEQDGLPIAVVRRARADVTGLPLPTAVYLAARPGLTLGSLPQALKPGVWRVSAEAWLEHDLPSVASPAEAASAPSLHEPLERFALEAVRDRTIEAWRQAPWSMSPPPGLYRSGSPRRRYLLFDSGAWRSVGRDEGVYRALALAGVTDALRFNASGPGAPGTLVVPAIAALPAPHRRAAALCSGLAPETSAGKEHYRNVPADLAQRIGSSLGQQVRGGTP